MQFRIDFKTCEFFVQADYSRKTSDYSDRSREGYGTYTETSIKIDLSDKDIDFALNESLFPGCDETYIDGVYTMHTGETFTRDEFRKVALEQIEEQVKEFEDTEDESYDEDYDY